MSPTSRRLPLGQQLLELGTGDAVRAALLRLVGREASPVDPAPDRGWVDPEEPGGLGQRQGRDVRTIRGILRVCIGEHERTLQRRATLRNPQHSRNFQHEPLRLSVTNPAHHPGMARTPEQRGPFGRWLVAERKARGWTADEMRSRVQEARGFAMAHSTYALLESGQRQPTDEQVRHLTAFLGSAPTTEPTKSATDIDRLVQTVATLTSAIDQQRQQIAALVGLVERLLPTQPPTRDDGDLHATAHAAAALLERDYAAGVASVHQAADEPSGALGTPPRPAPHGSLR